jgi:catechol 2,3-dioxygenase-like lactoylglutathione lyase family enzyme
MKPRIKVLTLGVADLERSLAFYRDGMGLPTEGIVGGEFEDGAVVFLRLEGGLILALWPLASLAKEARLATGEPLRPTFSIGHCVGSKAAVDAVIEQARRAGAAIQQPPGDRAWGGYSGYFRDPDGHLWEVAWNPAWPMED